MKNAKTMLSVILTAGFLILGISTAIAMKRSVGEAFGQDSACQNSRPAKIACTVPLIKRNEDYKIENLRKSFLDFIKFGDQAKLEFFEAAVILANSREKVTVKLKNILFSDALLSVFSYENMLDGGKTYIIDSVLENVEGTPIQGKTLQDVKALLENIFSVGVNSDLAQFLGMDYDFILACMQALFEKDVCSIDDVLLFCQRNMAEIKVKSLLNTYSLMEENIEKIDQAKIKGLPQILFFYKAIKKIIEDDCIYNDVWLHIRKNIAENRSFLRLKNCHITSDILENIIPFLNFNKNLKKLDLSKNQLITLPAKIGNLTHLQVLDLDNNRLLILPAEIGNLVNLEDIYLNNNEFTALPVEIGNLTHLHRLDLNNNGLSILPAEIGNLVGLKILILSHNKLKVFPAEIKNLVNLQTLSFGYNQFTTLPSGIGNLTHLQVLDLSYNRLENLPSEIGNLANLTALHLSKNQLITLPAEIGNLIHLQCLELAANWLTTLPSEIGNLTHLQVLDLYSNRLENLPLEIGNLANLTMLHLSKNQLITLPAEIGNLINLQCLKLAVNRLTTLPSEIGNLIHLQDLDLAVNRLTTLPSEIGNLVNLTHVFLCENPELNLPVEIDHNPDAQLVWLRNNFPRL